MDDRSTEELVEEACAATAQRRRRAMRQVRIRFAVVAALVLVVVFNDAVIMRALFVVLLVPLMRDFQKRLNNHAVRKYTDELMQHAAQAGAEYRATKHH